MKATELRIGNWVFDDYSGICAVSEIRKDIVLMHHINFNTNGLFDVSKIKPIPLTDKIILSIKGSFVSGHDKTKLCMKAPFGFEFHFDLCKEGYVLSVYCNTGCFVVQKCSFLHQLQNLYYTLTGEELTISLNKVIEVQSPDEGITTFASCHRQFFIRFKNIPQNEVSGVYDGDVGKIRDELGVSCYSFIQQGENFNIILSSASTGFLQDLCWFLDEFQYGKIPAYLIEAEQVGIGSYGEPVVKNIKIIKELKCVQLAVPKPKYKMDVTNPQLRCRS